MANEGLGWNPPSLNMNKLKHVFHPVVTGILGGGHTQDIQHLQGSRESRAPGKSFP